MTVSISRRRTAASTALFAIVAGLFWVGCQDGPDPTAPFDPSELLQDLRPAINVQERHTDRLLAIEGVIGTGVGLTDGRAAIRLFTTQPGIAGLPVELEGFPVEVKVTGLVMAFTEPSARQPRPVPIGVSTGHPLITAGTIGARVVDVFGNVYALSNNHVYANQNDADFSDPALQPGTVDGGSAPADQIGVLDSFMWIDFEGGDNEMDAALVSTTTAMLGNSTPADDGYGTPSSVTAIAYVGQPVQKYGRTTGLTHGQVSDVNVTLDVCYEALFGIICIKNARFIRQIGITPGAFSGGGDSGSLIVTDDEYLNPVGLLFAGGATHTFANPIDPVLDWFGVTIDDSGGEPPPNQPPTASFTYDCTTLSCDFDGSGSSDSDGNIVNYDWDFGDGNGASGATASHTYASDGTYTVTLTVTDDDDANGQDAQDITVSSTPPPNQPPTASFTHDCTDLSCDFDGSGSSDSDGSIVSYDWDFADGNGGSGSIVSHTYASEGTYSVTLTVTDDDDATDAAVQTVTVSAPPPPPSEIHVGDLDVAGTGWSGRRWYANVTVYAHDDGHGPQEGVLVEGYWTVRNNTYWSSCTTANVPAGDGRCTLALGNIHRRRSSVTFTVTSLTIAGQTYNAGANHDPDGDSNGTVITVYRP